jgi:hypothetical protein
MGTKVEAILEATNGEVGVLTAIDTMNASPTPD